MNRRRLSIVLVALVVVSAALFGVGQVRATRGVASADSAAADTLVDHDPPCFASHLGLSCSS